MSYILVTRFKLWFYFKELIIWIVKLAKSEDPNKFLYSGYSIGFDSRSEFSFPDGSMGKNIITFEVDMNSSVHIDNKKKDTLILGKGPTQELDGTTLTTDDQIQNFV